MREAVTLSQRLSITLRSLATGITLEALKFVKDYISISRNYCAGDAFNARRTDGNCMNIVQFCPHTVECIAQHFSITTSASDTAQYYSPSRIIFHAVIPAVAFASKGFSPNHLTDISAQGDYNSCHPPPPPPSPQDRFCDVKTLYR